MSPSYFGAPFSRREEQPSHVFFDSGSNARIERDSRFLGDKPDHRCDPEICSCRPGECGDPDEAFHFFKGSLSHPRFTASGTPLHFVSLRSPLACEARYDLFGKAGLV